MDPLPDPECTRKKPCGSCWPDYRPDSIRSTAKTLIDVLRKIALQHAQFPGDLCDAACKKEWLKLAGEANTFLAHGRVCKKFNCDQLYDRLRKAVDHALQGEAVEAYDALKHTD